MLYMLLSFVAVCSSIPATAASIPKPFTGRCVQVDPNFTYYKNRSPESIVSEVKAQGFDTVSLVATNESGINGDLVKAFHAAKMPVRLLTFGNGTYSTVDLPSGWEKWKMVCRKPSKPDGFIYICLNNPEYRNWKKRQLTEAVNKYGFGAIEMAESFLPAYNGPDSDLYGCLCDTCKAKFLKMHPEEQGIPDLDDKTSPRYWKTNPSLYRKWVDFRVATVVDFYDDIFNGPGGIRDKCPGVAVCTWTLAADLPNAVETMREWEAIDAGAVCAKVHPDAHCFQTDWPDWIKAELPPDYPKRYKPFVDALRKTDKKTPIVLQIDIGSQKQMRRDDQWIETCEKTARDIGFCQTNAYEFHLGLGVYTKPPKLISARFDGSGSRIILTFDKRLDPRTANDQKSYTLSKGEITSAKCDGNLVTLEVSEAEAGGELTVAACQDDPSVRFWKDYGKPNVSSKMSCRVEAR